MKITALAFAMLLLAGTPVMAENPSDPAAPGSQKSPGVAPNVAADSGKNNTDKADNPAGANNPNTPDPTQNTPGASPKS